MEKRYFPFIKRVGGKRQLLKKIDECLPNNFNNYFEPFLWGGAVFFHLRNKYGLKFHATISDINEQMIITYKVIQNDVESLIKELKKYPYNKEFYLNIRELDRKKNFNELSNVKKAARFIYLNKASFRGVYRENSQGYFNVPFWIYKNPTICDVEKLKRSQEALQNTTILCEDFELSLLNAKMWDFIYLDPPYDPLSKTANFTSYTKNWFWREEQERLFNVYKKLNSKWCYIMLSNHNTDFINGQYSQDKFKNIVKQVLPVRRQINFKLKEVEESLFINYSKWK